MTKQQRNTRPSRKSAKSRNKNRRPANRRRMFFESLEERRVLTAFFELNGAQTLVGGTNINVSNEPASSQSEMSVDINPTNPLNVAGFSHDVGSDFNEIDVFWSQDGGANWNTTTIDDGSNGINDGLGGNFRFDPSIAFDGDGNLYVAYGHITTDDARERLVVARSQDGGATFSQFAVVEDLIVSSRRLDKWHLATGLDPSTGGQAVYVAFIDFTPTGGAADDARVRVSGSNNGGAGWTAPITINDDSFVGNDLVQNPDPAVGPNGELYVAWHDRQSTEVMIDRDLDGLFSNNTTFGDDPSTGRDYVAADYTTDLQLTGIAPQNRRGVGTHTVLDVDTSGGPNNGRLYVAYVDRANAGADTNVFVRTSSNQGVGWTGGQVSTNGPFDYLPWLDVDQSSGTVNLAYYTTANSPAGDQEVDLRIHSSNDAAASFTPTLDITTARSNAGLASYAGEFLEYIGLAVHDGTVHGLWADNRGGAADIEAFTANASFSSATSGNVLTITGDDTGSPVEDDVTIRRSAANANFLEVIHNGEIAFAGLLASVDQIVVNTLDGDDKLTVDYRNGDPVPAGGLAFDAGNPTASDEFVVVGTTGTDDIDVELIDADSADVVVNGGATIDVDNVEWLLVDGQDGDDDVSYISPSGQDFIEFFVPGVSRSDSGVIRTMENAATTLLPVELIRLGIFGRVSFEDTDGGRADNFFVTGQDTDERFVLENDGDLRVDDVTATGLFPASPFVLATPGVQLLELRGLAGDDRFEIPGDHPFVFQLRVEGGDPDDGSDVLEFSSSGGDVTIDLESRQVTEAAFLAVEFGGVEHVEIDANGGAIAVDGTQNDDRISVSPHLATGDTLLKLAGLNTDFSITDVSGADGDFTIDGGDGEDEVTFVSDAQGRTHNVDIPAGRVQILPYIPIDLASVINVVMDGQAGLDTFNVTPGADTTVSILGGDPVGELQQPVADVLNIVTDGAAFEYLPGPEPDSGTFAVAAVEPVSFDEIELLQVDGANYILPDRFDDPDVIFRPNDTRTSAANLGSEKRVIETRLTLHDEGDAVDEDWFRITANETGKLIINTFFSHANGNIELQVFDDTGISIASSFSTDDNEQLIIPVVSQEVYAVRVFSSDDVPNIYELEIENFAAPVPDAPWMDPTDDSGMMNSDNVTNVGLSRVFIEADLQDFADMGIPILTPAQAAAGNEGAAVEVIVNGAAVGFASVIPGTNNTLFEYTFGAGELSTTFIPAGGGGGLNIVKGAVRIFDPHTSRAVTDRSQESRPLLMVYDPVAPAPSTPDMLASSDSGDPTDNVTNKMSPAFVGITEPNVKVRVLANGQIVGQGVATSDGRWEITIEPLVDGAYTITTEVEDLAGNISDISDALEILIDGTSPQRTTVDLVGMDVADLLTQFDLRGAPVITPGVAPTNTDTGLSTHDNITRGINQAAGQTDVLLRVSAEPSSTVALKDGEEVIATFTMPPLPYANQGPGGDIFVFVLITLDEDPHPLSTEAFDLAGNRGDQSEELLVTVDVTPAATPAATDLIESSDTFDDFPGAAGPVWTDSDDVTGINQPVFSGVAEKNNIVRIYATDTATATTTLIGTGLVGSDESDGVDQDGNGRYDVQVDTVADGVYDIVVELEDAAGNISARSAALQVTVDTLPPQRPTVDLIDAHDSGWSSMDNTTIGDPNAAPGTVGLVITAEPNSRAIVKDGENAIVDIIMPAAGTVTLFASFTDGGHPISVEAFDTPGNRSAQSEELLLTIDTVAPAASIPDLQSTSDSGFDNTDNVTNVTTPAFTGVAERNAKVTVWAIPVRGNTGVLQIIGEGIVGSNESDGTRPEDPQNGFWEVTVEPLEDGVYDIVTTIEDKAGNISPVSEPLRIEVDTYQPNTPFLDMVEASDSGRHDDDNVTNDTTPAVTATTHDPNNADHIFATNFFYRIYDRDEASDETLLYASAISALTLDTTTLPALAENWHNLKLEVEDRAGNISEDFLLDVLIDTTAYLGEGDLHGDSDTGVWGYDATMNDRITSDKLPAWFGTAEANNIVTVTIDGNVLGGTTVAVPLDGDDAFQPQNPPYNNIEGNWTLQTVLDNADGSVLSDGEHTVVFTYEDLAGNRVNQAPFTIFIDSEGPVITNLTQGEVFLNGSLSTSVFDGETSLFDAKPSTGPEPTISSIVVHFSDGPARTANYQHAALWLASALAEGQFKLVGDATGPVNILDVNLVTGLSLSGQTITSSLPGSDAILGLELVVHDPVDGVLFNGDDIGTPLADDRYTIEVADTITDWAGNALDGESQASTPFDGQDFPLPTPDIFPTGDGQHGGDFTARFTVDSVAELGVWAAGNVWVDTNGNYLFDPENVDASNRDITYATGIASDDVFAGNFAGARSTADGFDKLAAFGELNGALRFIVDLDNDGVADVDAANTLPNIHGAPFAGNWDGDAANGDEVALFTGTQWYLDTNHSFQIDAADTTFSGNMAGLPFAGDFDGDGNDDLGTWVDDTVFIDFASDGLDGNSDASFRFGYIGAKEVPVAADMDGDNIDDIGLWVPDREGVTPREGAEWYFLVSHGRSITSRITFDTRLATNVVEFTPEPFGWDKSASFGDQFARPVVGNFDPPNLPDAGSGVVDIDRLAFDFNGDGVAATIPDAFGMIEMISQIRKANGSPYAKLFASEANAPFGDHDFDSDIDLVDVFLLLRATADRIQGVIGASAAEGEASLATPRQTQAARLDQPAEFIAIPAVDDDDELIYAIAQNLGAGEDERDEFFLNF